MRIVFSETALADLDQIFKYLASNYPALIEPVEQRINSVLARLQEWPESARRVTQRTNTRVVPLIRYPYRIFYRLTDDAIVVVHIRHTSREPWDDDR
jgi:toxin ParE1/3/4